MAYTYLILKELTTLGELVAIPSVTGDEASIADFVRDKNASFGHRVIGLGDNVAVHIAGVDRTRALVLSGHMDTVPPAEWGDDPFSLQYIAEESVVRGLGVSDMKGGLALMMGLAEDTAQQKPPCDQYHLYTTHEEGDQRGAQTVTRWLQEEVQYITTAGGIILEPTDASYVGVGIRGDTDWFVSAEGPGGHASGEFDIAAIEKLGALIVALPDIRRAWAEDYSHPVLGKPMINATVLRAGQAHNVVPPGAVCTLNLRVTPQLVPALDEVRQSLENIYGVTIRQSGQPTPSFCGPTERIYQTIEQALPGMPFRSFPGATEQPYYEACGVPMVALGPGDDAMMHKPGESMKISSFVSCKRILERIIGHF